MATVAGKGVFFAGGDKDVRTFPKLTNAVV